MTHFSKLALMMMVMYWVLPCQHQLTRISPPWQIIHVLLWWQFLHMWIFSFTEFEINGIARAFLDERTKLRKKMRKNWGKMGENNRRIRKCSFLAHPKLKVWLHPSISLLILYSQFIDSFHRPVHKKEFIYLFVCLFIYLLIYLFIYLFTYFFIYIYSFFFSLPKISSAKVFTYSVRNPYLPPQIRNQKC